MLKLNSLSSFLIFCSLLIAESLIGDQIFKDKNQNDIRIHVVQSFEEMNQERSQEILVKSFMDVYEDVPLIELNPAFQSIGDVRRFYENYFKEELEHFKDGHLIWVQAFFNDQLVGWATFELESSEPNAAYMNILTVHPDDQGKGIGRYLTFSICSEELFPMIEAINVLIRKINVKSYNFYYHLGFFDSNYQRQDNFVDNSLLTGIRWEKNIIHE